MVVDAKETPATVQGAITENGLYVGSQPLRQGIFRGMSQLQLHQSKNPHPKLLRVSCCHLCPCLSIGDTTDVSSAVPQP